MTIPTQISGGKLSAFLFSTLLTACILPLNTEGQVTFETIKTFTGPEGGYPASGPLILGQDGTLYGFTYGGGSSEFGTLFKINPDGSGHTVLRNFDGELASPNNLIQASDGAFYGTTSFNGIYNSGTVFKINSDGSGFTVIHHFDGNNGAWPLAGLIQADDGALYGTAWTGGAFGPPGVIFKLTTDGSSYSVIKNFDGIEAGSPRAPLMQGSDGALYGTTSLDATDWGTVFKVQPDGSGFAVLKTFSGPDGGFPVSGVIEGSDGALYGTTPSDGPYGGGTIYKLNRDGSGAEVLHAFDGTGGTAPQGAVIQAADGALYGTAQLGGGADFGTVFKINADGTGFTALHSFSGLDGSYPSTALVQASDGAFYGTTLAGGEFDMGTIFRLVVTPVNPVVTLTGPAAGSLFAVNTPVTFSASFTDAGGGTHTGTWTFDTVTVPATILEPDGQNPGSASATHSFSAAGVYKATLTINSSTGGSATAELLDGAELLVVVYDATAGFVTGNGLIDSAPGAYVLDPNLAGKANFAFVSRYQKGAAIPTGETAFHFNVAGLKFQSSSYEWLVVAGRKAQFKGAGKINGDPGFGFLLTAADNQLGGADEFRIKIWDTLSGGIIYDNAGGASDDIDSANPQAIKAGNIVIHK